MNTSTRIMLLLLAMTAFVITGCSDDDKSPTTVTDMGKGAMVRVVHASPDAPAVDVYAEGVAAPLIEDLAYGDTSPYLELAAGTYNVQLRAAGSEPTSGIAYETGDLTIPEGAKITAAAVGLLGSMNEADKFRVMPLVENFTDPGAGMASVRIIHASADAPTVALDVGDDATVEVPDFARFGDTGEAGVPLPSGAKLQIAIWAGSTLSRVTAFTTPDLPAGAELFVFATGLLGQAPREMDGFSLLAVGPDGSIGFIRQNPVVFALHSSPNAPAVDIYAGGAELVDNLNFGEISAAIQVPPGSYDLSFRANSSGAEAATATTPDLAAGQRYLAVASGFLGGTGDEAFTLLAYADGFDLDMMSPLVRVIHASPDAPAVDVGTVSGGTVTAVGAFSNLAYRQGSEATGTALPVGMLPIGVAATGGTSPVASFTVGTTSGLRGFAVAAGSLLGNGETFRLIVVDTGVFPWAAAEVAPNL